MDVGSVKGSMRECEEQHHREQCRALLLPVDVGQKVGQQRLERVAFTLRHSNIVLRRAAEIRQLGVRPGRKMAAP